MLVGQSVDWAVTATLEEFQRDENSVHRLVDRGVAAFERMLSSSSATCDGMKAGRYPPDQAQPLHHDYYAYYLPEGKVENSREKVARCLRNLLASDLFQEILNVHPGKWSPPKTLVSPSFRIPRACSVYASYDFYYSRPNGDLVIVDWKTGALNSDSSREALKQLGVYALYGVYALKLKPERVKVVSAWLQVPVPWVPTSITFEELKTIRDEIVADWQAETASVVFDASERRSPVFVADRADYRPEPERLKCFRCRFREICPEGQAMIATSKHLEPGEFQN